VRWLKKRRAAANKPGMTRAEFDRVRAALDRIGENVTRLEYDAAFWKLVQDEDMWP